MSSPFEAAIAAAETLPHARGNAVIVATQDNGARLTYSRGDAADVLALTRAIMGLAVADLHGPRPGRDRAAFWVWTDIDGAGERWHLAVQGGDGEDLDTLRFVLDDFEDDAENYTDCPTVPIAAPAPLPAQAEG